MSMEPFVKVRGTAAPLLAANVDTDVIMPKQFLKGIDRNGLERGVFFDLRFLPDGVPNPEFILNRSPFQGASFLLVGPNFGCGSSREHAVWGLKQLGIRAIIGTSFAGIFFDNCQRNGLLLIQLTPAQVDLIASVLTKQGCTKVTIDLPTQRISFENGLYISFDIDPLRKEYLLLGLDAIGATLQRAPLIEAFEQEHHRRHPWLA
ncbi:3-isopropylmalate dehydratase small subunit [Metapseudomonas otitidis]|uniref:3-isopropylmalate dehydratase small subunit n=1 Tax=Metapseudomonas otitidis TaxID=319939 RepID=UPI0035A2216D